jgi:hypothetical protein
MDLRDISQRLRDGDGNDALRDAVNFNRQYLTRTEYNPYHYEESTTDDRLTQEGYLSGDDVSIGSISEAEAFDMLARGTFSSFTREFSSMLSDATRLTNSIISTSYIKGGDDLGKRFINTLFDKGMGDDDGKYQGLRPINNPNVEHLRDKMFNMMINRVNAGAEDRTNRLMRESETSSDYLSRDYINKPGIGPVINLIHSADKQLSIDLFQLQNSSITDVLYQSILNRANDLANGDFKVDIKLATPDQGGDRTSFIILGPNLVQLERFHRLREEIAHRARESGGDEAYQQVMDSFNIIQANRKNHPKLYGTDQYMALGSLNLTQPVGSSVHQEGSTYESLRIFERNQEVEDRIARGESLSDIDIRTRARAKLFRQSRSILDRTTSSNRALHFTGESQIAGSGDTYNNLRSALNYLKQDKTQSSRMGLILDQVFLLQLADVDGVAKRQRSGEMGTFDDSGKGTNRERFKRYEGIQNDLTNLILSGRADVAVDIRNYQSSVVDPMYHAMESIMGDDFIDKYGGSLERLVGLGTTEERRSNLERISSLYGNQLTPDVINQLLVMTSGRIKLSTYTKQHLKTYMVYDNEGILAYSDGSSNKGMYSMAMGLDDDDERANAEIGLELMSRVIKEPNTNDPYGLDDEELSYELDLGGDTFRQRFRDLTGGEVGTQYSTIRASWESSVNSKKLHELKRALDKLNQDIGGKGLEIGYILGGRSGSERVGLNISINTNAFINNQGLEAFGNRGLNKLSFRLTTLGDIVYLANEAKVITQDRFVNASSKDVYIPFLGHIRSGTTKDIDPITGTVLSMARMSSEMLYQELIHGPSEYLRRKDSSNLNLTFLEHLEFLSTGRRNGGRFFQEMDLNDRGTIENLIRVVKGKYTNESFSPLLKDLRQLRGQTKEDIGISNVFIERVADALLVLSQTRQGSIARTQAIKELGLLYNEESIGVNLGLDLDMVNNQMDGGYHAYLNDATRQIKASFLEDKQTHSQISTYGGSQAYFRQSLYGVTDSNQYDEMFRLRAYAEDEGIGIAQLHQYNALSVLSYDPTTNLGMPGTIRSIADGASSRPSYDLRGGMSIYGMGRQQLGNVISAQMINKTVVGSITTRSEYLLYLNGLGISDMRARGMADRLFKGEEQLLTYMFSPGKIAQIPQRLKNLMGSRPLMTMSAGAQGALEDTNNLGEYIEDYISSLKERAESALREKAKRLGVHYSDTYIKESVDQIIDERSELGAIFSNRIRSVISKDLANIIDALRVDISEELGLVEEDFNEGALGHEILRGRLISLDARSTGLKGFTGAGRDKSPLVIIQLAGAYTDYFYANPGYGGPKGTREGFLDRTEKRIKASMLRADWSDGNNRLIARAGDVVAFDDKSQRLVVIGADSRIKEVIDIGDIDAPSLDRQLASEGLEQINNGQRSVLQDVADNLKGIRGESSFATLGKKVFDRSGEDSISYMLKSGRLVGHPDTNQLMFEFVDLNTIKPGPRRVEGIGSLIKGIGVFMKNQFFDDAAEYLNKHFGSSRHQSAMSLDNIQSKDIFGIMNPSNLKSFFLSHGAEIMRSPQGINTLMSMDSKMMAASLLLSFGLEPYILEGNKVALNKTMGLLYRQAMSEDMGIYYKEVAKLSALLNVNENKLRDKAREYLIHDRRMANPSEYDIDQVMRDKTLTKQFSDELAGMALIKKTAYNPLQVGALAGISITDLTQALAGDEAAGTRLKSYIGRVVNPERQGLSIHGDDISHRNAAIILSALDMMTQLSSQNQLMRVPLDINLSDKNVRDQITALMGISPRTMDEMDDREQSQLIAAIKGIISSSPTLLVSLDVAFSMSKEPIGSKLTGNLEYQHLMKPFLDQATAFKRGGSIDKLRAVVANLLAAGHKGETASTMFTSSEDWNDVGIFSITDTRFLDPAFQSAFLGMYGGADDNKLTSIKKRYNELSERRKEEFSELIGMLGKPGIDKHTVLNQLREKLFDEDIALLNEATDLARAFDLDSNKRFGTDQSLSILNRLSHKSMTFYLPAVAFETIEGGDNAGLIRMTFDSDGERLANDTKTFVYLPSADTLRLIGSRFSDYIDPIVASTLHLSKAFTPGSSLRRTINRMSRAELDGDYSVILTPDDVAELNKLYATANQMTELLAEASAGSRIQQTFGGENRLPGAVTFPGASFLVPDSMVFLGSEVLRRHGGLLNPHKSRAYEQLEGIDTKDLDELSLRVLEANKNIISRGLDSKDVSLINQMRVLSKQALNIGMDAESEWTSLILNANRLIDETKNKDVITAFQAQIDMWRSSRTKVEAPAHTRIPNIFTDFNDLDLSENIRGTESKGRFSSKVKNIFDGLKRDGITLDSTERKYTIQSIIDKEIDAFKHTRDRLIERQARVDPSARDTLMRESIDRLNTVISDLKAIRKGDMSLSQRVAAVERTLAINDTTNLMEVQAHRSAPFGGTESIRQGLFVINSIELLNERGRQIDGGIQYDEGRNKTLSLYSPLSYLTSHLGDFDGDPYTAIFNGIMDIENSIAKRLSDIQRYDLEIKIINQELRGERVWNDKRISLSRESRLKREEQLISIYERKTKAEQDIGRLQIKIDSIKSTIDSSGHTKAVKKEIANYMGINIKHLLAESEGGYLSKPVGLPEVYSFIEQGHGLFDISKEATTSQQLTGLIESVFINRDNGVVSVESDQRLIKERLGKLNGSLANSLLYMDELRDTLYQDVRAALGDGLNEDEYNKAIQEQLIPGMVNRAKGLENTQKILSLASGSSMGLTTYDTLVNVLGDAGGDILGKSYNVLVSTLYSDSPLIAASHVLNTETGRQVLINSLGEEKANQLIEGLVQAQNQSEAMLGGVKSVQQLLRDSIKFKSDGGDILSQLGDLRARYDASNDESERKALIKEMSSTLGPGPGLSSLIRLNDLISYRSALSPISISDVEQVSDVLKTHLGIGTDKRYSVEAGERVERVSEFDELALSLSRLSGVDAKDLTAFDVAAYKTANELKNLMVAFRYEKNLKDGVGLNEGGSNVANLIEESNRNKLLRMGASEDQVDTLMNKEVDDRLYLYRDRLPSILGIKESELDEHLGNKSYKERSLLLEIIETTDESNNAWLGLMGENLQRFAQFSEVRNKAAGLAANGGGRFILPEDFQQSDLTLVMMNLATSGKIDGASSQLLMRSVVAGFEYEGLDRDQTEAMVFKSIMAGGMMSTHEDNPVISLLSEFMEAQGVTIDTKIGNKERIYTAQYNTGAAFLMDQLRGTGTAARSESISDMLMAHSRAAKPETNQMDWFLQHYVTTLTEHGQYDDVRVVQEEIRNMRAQTGQVDDNELLNLTRQYSPLLNAQDEAIITAAGKAEERRDALDVLAPVLLGFAGAAIAGGGLSPDTVSDLVGGAVINTAYGKSSYLNRGVTALPGLVFGSSFKVKQAMEESNGNIVQAITGSVAREIGFAVGASIAAPFMSNLLDSGVSKLLTGSSHLRNRRDKRLEHGAFEIDEYANLKGFGSFVANTVLSSVMGMLMGNAAKQLVRADLPDMGVIEAFSQSSQGMLNAINNYQTEMQAKAALDISVESDDNVDYEVDIDPIDTMQEISLDTEYDIDFNYTDTPGMVMLGVSLTVEEYYQPA